MLNSTRKFPGLLAVVLAALAVPGPAAPAAARSSAGACPAWLTAAGVLNARTQAKAAVRYQIHGVAVGPTRALVGGFIRSRGPSWFLVQYGRGPHYGSCSLWQKNVASEHVAKIQLRGLHPSATYHFRLVAKTAAGTVFGADRTLRTLAGGRIPQGVEIGKVAVGGMTRAAALELVGRTLAAPLRLSYAGAFWHVTRAKAGARVDAREAVGSALTASPGQVLPAAAVSVDPVVLGRFLTSLSVRWSRESRQASVKLVGKRAVIRSPRRGVVVDTKRMALLITRALKTGDRRLLHVAVKTAPPASGPPAKAVVVRLGSQTLTAYLNGRPVLTTPVTTGRPALPTPIGSFYIHFRASPYTFISPWPQGSPYYYPPAPVTWAMYFYDNDFLHDDPAEPSYAYGAGSEYGSWASHGCVHVPHDSMAFLFNWLPVGAPVIVSQN